MLKKNPKIHKKKLKILKKCKKKFFFWKFIVFARKYDILLVSPIKEISLQPQLSSPPCLRTQGGYPERYKQRNKRTNGNPHV